MAAEAPGFEDVQPDAYYAAPVSELEGLGVFVGTGCEEGFCPDEAIDRKTMAVWVVRILDGRDPSPVAESRFDDVDADSFHAAFIERMAELEITTGCGDLSGFCPDSSVTRAQTAVFISRAYGLAEGPDPGFSDVPEDAWYAADVARLAASGITVGCGDGTRFCPGRHTTRAQMATFLWRAENPSGLAVDVPAVGDDSPMVGQSLTLDATVRNRGWRPSAPTTLRWYLSADSTITTTDTEVGAVPVSGLDPSASRAESVLVYAPLARGTYYYGACVDSASGMSDTADACSDAVAVAVSAFRTQGLARVADGLTGGERGAIDGIRALARVDPSMAHRVGGSLWLSDGVTDDELRVVTDLVYLARSHPELAVRIATVPPDTTGNLLGTVLRSLEVTLYYRPGLSARLLGQSWFRDGLTEDEASLVVVLQVVLNDYAGVEDLFERLLHGAHVQSATITVPLAGEVDLFVVGTSQSGLDEVLEDLAYGVETQEAFVGSPWPNPDVIALLGLEPDPERVEAGWHSGTHIVLTNRSEHVVWHELAHYYFDYENATRWLAEGAAEFLSSHTSEQSGKGSVLNHYVWAETIISESCAPHGAGDIRGWIDATARQAEGPYEYCHYQLGHVLLAELYWYVGREVVPSALRDLHEEHSTIGRPPTEDEIYDAFLSNTPRSQQDRLRACYNRLHGRSMPDSQSVPSPETRDALAALYNATDGSGWKNNDNWLSTAPLHQWHGVDTGCDGSVVRLDLSDNGLSGSIPVELGGLSNLTWLNLDRNGLSGPIPVELGNLSNLTQLYLRDNGLSGPIPVELGGLSNLTTLWLGGNVLSGPIPVELGDLSNLTQLNLSGNGLSGPIPVELGGLSNLISINLSGSGLSGPIPVELGDLSNLIQLYLSGNGLSGPIPSELGALSNLTQLDLGANDLSGPIPVELGALSNLTSLWLNGNQLTGCVPGALVAVQDNDIDDLGLPVCGDS